MRNGIFYVFACSLSLTLFAIGCGDDDSTSDSEETVADATSDGEADSTVEDADVEAGMDADTESTDADSGGTDGDTTGPSDSGDVGNDADATCVPTDVGEVCDGKDNDCNGQTDECCTTYYRDSDGDGYGLNSNSVESCTEPMGFATQDGDCDDSDADKNPGESEVCDGKDNDCNAQTDENVKTEYCEDSDSDGYGNSSQTTRACSAPSGYVESPCTDCDDTDGSANPGASEVCNDGTDNDCDGDIDENCQGNCYRDKDGDNYGVSGNTGPCMSSDFVKRDGDCDDGDMSVNPGASETCDGVDNDCNGATDECCDTYYEDSDTDGYGNSSVTKEACSKPSGYVADDTDCLDTDRKVNPGQTNYFDTTHNGGGWDYNCDGTDDQRWESTLDFCRRAGPGVCTSSNGWKTSSAPLCGNSAEYLENCTFQSNSCSATYKSRTQECR